MWPKAVNTVYRWDCRPHSPASKLANGDSGGTQSIPRGGSLRANERPRRPQKAMFSSASLHLKIYVCKTTSEPQHQNTHQDHRGDRGAWLCSAGHTSPQLGAAILTGKLLPSTKQEPWAPTVELQAFLITLHFILIHLDGVQRGGQDGNLT